MAGCKNDGFLYFHYELFKDIGKKKNNYGLTIEKKRRHAKSASFRGKLANRVTSRGKLANHANFRYKVANITIVFAAKS